MTKKILIAKVVAAHGIKGEVKLVVFTKHVNEIENYQCFDINSKEIKIKIHNGNNIKKSKNNDFIVIAKISGIDDRNEAEKLKNYEIFINREQLAELQEDEFYISDLIGLEIKANDEVAGKVINVYDFGGGVMLEIEFEKENTLPGYSKIETIPFKDEFFPVVNVRGGFILADLPEISTKNNH